MPVTHEDPEAMRDSYYVPDDDEAMERINTAQERVEVTEYRSVGDYSTKDSGERAQFDSGMVRDTQTGKPRYDLIPLAPLKRVAELYARGAEKYGERNWEQANSDEELSRFTASLLRHAYQAIEGQEDEDHFAAVVFNAFGAMFVKAKMGHREPTMKNVMAALEAFGIDMSDVSLTPVPDEPEPPLSDLGGDDA